MDFSTIADLAGNAIIAVCFVWVLYWFLNKDIPERNARLEKIIASHERDQAQYMTDLREIRQVHNDRIKELAMMIAELSKQIQNMASEHTIQARLSHEAISALSLSVSTLASQLGVKINK